MKLNLVPTHVSRGGQTRTAVFFAVLIAAAGFVLAFMMISTSQSAIAREQERIDRAKPIAEQAVRVSKQADATIQSSRGLLLNTALAEAMIAHNSKYPALYDEIKQYIPSFFRITAMEAQPAGQMTTVTIDGVIQNYQQYADLMLALLRHPQARAVSRSGYQQTEPFVPPLVEIDQAGRPVRPGQARIPDNAMDRLDWQIANASANTNLGFTGVGNFGTVDQDVIVRGAMPNWSSIRVAVVLERNMMVPEPTATLQSSTALWGGSPTIPAPGAGANPATGTTTGAPGTPPPAGRGAGAPRPGDEE